MEVVELTQYLTLPMEPARATAQFNRTGSPGSMCQNSFHVDVPPMPLIAAENPADACNLLQELFLATIDAGVSPGPDIDHSCKPLAQLVIDQREQSMTREFFHRDQKPGRIGLQRFSTKQGDQLGGGSVQSGSSTTNHRGEATRSEDQRSHLFDRGV
ncbi:unnamed protein product [Taenia asiatica]|uniref:DUF5726 domain-containing protein n=1 Tax=Taenia asiatica TaxID=60517 RepID=A0A0R3W5H1_TAEAS|nr:unnamed protein product [Taenia asiatica]